MGLFNPFTLYTHRRMLDAAIYVLKSYRIQNGDYKLKVQWMRKDGMDFGFRETIRIKKEEVKNWYAVTSIR